MVFEEHATILLTHSWGRVVMQRCECGAVRGHAGWGCVPVKYVGCTLACVPMILPAPWHCSSSVCACDLYPCTGACVFTCVVVHSVGGGS